MLLASSTPKRSTARGFTLRVTECFRRANPPAFATPSEDLCAGPRPLWSQWAAVARSARGRVEAAAAHDRKPGGQGNLTRAAPARPARRRSCNPRLSHVKQATFSLRVGSSVPHTASTSTNTDAGGHTTPHDPHRLPLSRTTNGTTGVSTAGQPCGRRRSASSRAGSDRQRRSVHLVLVG
jgi:hypothetical protein